VKLIALAVALVVWFNASSQQEGKRIYAAPIGFANLPDTLTITGNVPTEVQLSITGTKRELLFLGFKRVQVLVNLARVSRGRFTQRLSTSDILLPAGLEPNDVRILSPLSVDLMVEPLVSRSIPVVVTLTGSVPASHLLSEVPQSYPGWVEVSGAESAVTHLRNIPTEAISLARVRESFEREVALEYDRRVFLAEPERVVVSVLISVRGQRVLANVPPTILVDEEDMFAEVSPKTVSLTLDGPQALLDTLSSGDVSVLIDLSGKPPGSYTLAPEIIVPSGVRKFVMDVDSLTVIISRASGSQSM
jgi:YbbR domain-containing protein